MNAIRNYILLKLAEILLPVLRQEIVEEQTAAILADLEANGLTDADKALVDSVLDQPAA